jgi:Fe-S-cluster containining protein
MASHPCLSCGACCAYFRVAFYWREAEKNPPAGIESVYGVPRDLVEELDDFTRCMKGTNIKRGAQCVALSGRIGKKVACTIYEKRPSPCRAFAASYVHGSVNKRCDEARAAHGLPALTPKDWIGVPSE